MSFTSEANLREQGAAHPAEHQMWSRVPVLCTGSIAQEQSTLLTKRALQRAGCKTRQGPQGCCAVASASERRGEGTEVLINARPASGSAWHHGRPSGCAAAAIALAHAHSHQVLACVRGTVITGGRAAWRSYGCRRRLAPGAAAGLDQQSAAARLWSCACLLPRDRDLCVRWTLSTPKCSASGA